MARAAIRQVLFGTAAAGLLMGCVEGASSGGSAGGSILPPADAPATRRGGNQEVEAPEVFRVTDTALWDGRPSLGGIWVASPDVTDPERVVMLNPANGMTVTGALFRRERDNPGPTLQISSDAAEALGLLAGQPAEIRVTALRKIETEAPAPAEAATEGEAATAVAAGTEATAAEDETAPAEATAVAAAALDAVDGGADAAAVPADAVAADATVEVPEAAPPKKKTWRERRAEAKAAREAAKAAKAAEAAGGAVVAGAGVAGAGVAGAEVAATVAAGDTATSGAAVVAEVETVPLDARSAEVAEAADAAAAAGAAAAPEKRKTRRQIKAEEKAAAAAAIIDAPPEAPAAVARPIQVASFSKEENANRAVEALAKVGITGSARKGESSGKVFWGVIAMGDDTLLASIKKAGFADAFFLN